MRRALSAPALFRTHRQPRATADPDPVAEPSFGPVPVRPKAGADLGPVAEPSFGLVPTWH
ncbi:hypothetical protein [Paractinoplanes toevensis]|uniref:Uncharacterized protein n=1 Tax=Paractinoplanes toevensis TaxID=571911 RepID=A0A919TF93_9ACTN|nr:hypothetical protein [Actinoplanes toevensis]GIM94553.1 hypothetical protein Ato02nite_063460 [Actinoplanes toevensis]